MGMSELSEKTQLSLTDISFFDATLNASQRDAVKLALESPEVACIHGPPGMLNCTLNYHTFSPSHVLLRDRKNAHTD